MRLSMIVLAASMAYGAVGNLQVRGVTSTQAVLAYTAPDTNPCFVEVSESQSYRPLAHDVDPALFAGSNLDSRPEGTASGVQRVFVAGKGGPRRKQRQVVFASAPGVHESLLSNYVRRQSGYRTFLTATLRAILTTRRYPQILQ